MKRHLAAILYADVCGYSRLTQKNEERAIQLLSSAMNQFNELIQAHEGERKNEAGDAILADFSTALSALETAIEFQTLMAQRNGDVDIEDRFEFRIGLHIGEVVHDRGDIFGEGVNLAARIQGLAEPGGITLSSGFHDQIRSRIRKTFHDTGFHHLKNISGSVRVFSLGISDLGDRPHPTDFLNTRMKDQPLFDLQPGERKKSVSATGGCLCRDIRYEITGDHVGTGFCHCNFCKKALGAPVNAWVAYYAGDVKFLNRDPDQYCSSKIAMRGFCSKCGTSLTYQLLKPEASDFLIICTGSLDHPEDYPPTWHGSTESQLPWLEIHDELPRMQSAEAPALKKAWVAVGVEDPAMWIPD